MTPSPVSLAMVTLDAAEVAPLADFWSAALGWPTVVATDDYAMLQGPSNALGIGRIPDYQAPTWPDSGHKQFHFDLSAPDVEAAAAALVELGATRPEVQPGETWIVLLDPAGHPFCVTDAANWG
ncbi:VOC family protein [Kribbia dieselivorans]|uniref:VOC family protein n=1 Tax=Kribbia dieselivorans TaxID=331526 RepID=UPI00083924C6|nr:VOC family protein [Kribbia dieselivorans]